MANVPTSLPEFAEVLLPLPLYATFTYRIPGEYRGKVGAGFRVVVPFGRNKFYTGIVVGFPVSAVAGFDVKEIAVVPDQAPIVRHPQVKFWEWLADYYLCATGEVYKAAVPAGLKVESETFVEVNPDYDIAEMPLADDREAAIYQLIDHEGHIRVEGLAKELKDFKGVPAAVGRMISRGVLIISEKLVERYRTRVVSHARIAGGRDGLSAAFAAVKGAPKQEAVLLALVELSGLQRPGVPAEVTKAALLERSGASASVLSAVEKKGVIEIYKKEVNRFRFEGKASRTLPRLSEAQAEALDAIHRSWLEKEVTLLRGVTSSGKTEIYIHIINFVLNQGNQVLYLVPEIALTTQLTRRLQDVFGERVVIYHSKFSDNERVDIWKKLLRSSEPCVVIGARSSIFLPFAKLGAVIVDEEHEPSFKQYEPAPRYNARDAAMVLARMHGARTLLGSATPSVETYWKALEGKFGLVELLTRFGEVSLPRIEVIDMHEARKAKVVRGALGLKTIKLIRESLAKGAQAILFQNRRGYAPVARCKQCAWTPRCSACDVALTYHRAIRQLQCHYCGALYPLPQVCPQCGEPAIEVLGYGTERVEEELAEIFPETRVARMDLDSTRNKDSYEKIIDDFSARKAGLLVGTQMVTKGLDFDGVETVAVVSADNLINFPDFRAAERAFNMLEQVSGRAGRREGAPGRVVIQTCQPAHPVLAFVKAHNYEGFFRREIEERRRYFYPPFSRVVNLYLKHRDPAALRGIAGRYADHLRRLLGSRVYGPEEPPVGRVQNLYIRKIMLKIEPDASMVKVKELLRATYIQLHSLPDMKSTIVYYDVDPQ